jgi:DNA polymerase-3 subunit delta
MAGSHRSRSAGKATFQDLKDRDLKTKKYRPVYLLVGEDTYRLEKVMAHLREDLLGPGGAAFNYHAYQGDQTGIDSVLQQALSYPMLGGRQLIHLRDVDKCVASAAAESALLGYLADPSAASILVMSATRVDGRKRWVKTCREAGYFFDFSPPRGAELSQWVRKTAQLAGVPLTGGLADLLIDLVGEDLYALAAEIEKLGLLVEASGAELDSDRLEHWIVQQRMGEVFDLTNALTPGDAVPGLRVWRRQAAWGRGAMDQAPLLLSRLRKMALVVSLEAEGFSAREIPSVIGMHPYACQQLLRAAHQLGPDRLQHALAACQRCDARLKGSAVPPDIIMERTIIEVCAVDT